MTTENFPTASVSIYETCLQVDAAGKSQNCGGDAEKLPAHSSRGNITVTLHAPYFISLSSVEAEKRDNSVNYIAESLRAADKLVKKVNATPAHYGRSDLYLAKQTLQTVALRQSEGLKAIICPETMGKINQLGTLDEVIELCTLDDEMLPCVDFGHLNARTHGEIKTIDDYAAMLDKIENTLGHDRLSQMHIHFSKIEYTNSGERRHLTFADEIYGPQYEPLCELLAKRNLNCTVICESDGTQAEDASLMKKAYLGYLK